MGLSGFHWLEELKQDAGFAVRVLTRNPAFTVTVIATLALGLGATTAVFSVISGVVLEPLPFAEPDRLVKVSATSHLRPDGGAVPDLDELKRRNQTLAAMAGYEVTARYLRRGDAPERVMTVQVQPEFFAILGVPALRGRTHGTGDGPHVAVISEAFWKTRLAADPSIVDSAIVLDDRAYTVVGVMPAAFQFPYRAGSLLSGVATEERTDLWIPFEGPLPPRSRISGVIGRLRPTVAVGAAESELTAIAQQLETESGGTDRMRGIRVVSLSRGVVSSAVRQPLFALFVAVALLLTLACSNVANLFLVRLTLRGREIAMRRALGASTGRLARQLLIETLALSLTGGLLGLLLGWLGTTSIMQLVSTQVPRAQDVQLDWRVLLFLVGLCTLIGFGLNLVSVATLRRSDLRSVLQQSSGHSTVHSRRLRDGLVIAETALAFVLAVGAVLLIRELVRLRHTDPGLEPTNVVTLHVGHRMTAKTDVSQFYQIAERVEHLPGVRAAGFTQLLPLQNWGWAVNSNSVRERGAAPSTTVFEVEIRYVTPGYFRALGIPVRGRAFLDSDDRTAPPVMMINETLARLIFPGEDPIGKLTERGAAIVGIAGDVRQLNLDLPARPEIYTPIAQNWSQLSELGLTLVVSAGDRAATIVDPVRAIVRDVNPNLAVFRIKTMDAVVEDSLDNFTVYLSLVAVAAVLALILAATGTYAVISHLAAARTREFAIRVAVGADRARVIWLVIGQGLRLAAIGLTVGLFGALASGRLLAGLPMQVRPPDAVTLVPTAVLMAIIVVAACLVPARRAAVSDPMTVLRSE
jgi:putative ABC transport system permease protein